MQRCRLIVQCLWVFYFWRCGPGCSTGPAESQATHCGNTWQGGRRHSRQPGSRKDCRFRHARGGSSTHRSNFLRRISYRPKRSSGDTAGGPARYEGPLAPGMRGGPWHARSQQRHGCGQWFWGSTKSRAQPTRTTNNQNITFVIKSRHSRPGGAPCRQTQ